MENLIDNIGDENYQIKVFIDPDEVKETELKTKRELQEELFNKIINFVNFEHRRNVFGN